MDEIDKLIPGQRVLKINYRDGRGSQGLQVTAQSSAPFSGHDRVEQRVERHIYQDYLRALALQFPHEKLKTPGGRRVRQVDFLSVGVRRIMVATLRQEPLQIGSFEAVM